MRVLFLIAKKRSLVVAIIAVLLAILLIFGSSRLAEGNAEASFRKSAVMSNMLEKTNILRERLGLTTLEPDSGLVRSALAKAQDMDHGAYWAHRAPNGGYFSAYIWNELPYSEVVGENLARCYANYDEAFSALVNSPTHFRVLTGSFSKVGVSSIVDSAGCESIVMHFAS